MEFEGYSDGWEFDEFNEFETGCKKEFIMFINWILTMILVFICDEN